MGLVIAMGLRAMGIADSIVNLAFGLTLGSVAVAFALAFGLGGRQPAERLLSDLLDKAKTEAKHPNPLRQNEMKPNNPVSPTTSAPVNPVNPIAPTPINPENPKPPIPPYSDE